MNWSRLKRFLQSVPARLHGSYVDVGAETVTRLSSKAHFVPDELLERRIKAARDLVGNRPVKADRK